MAAMLLRAGAEPDGKALIEAASHRNLNIIKLLFKATSDDGKALVAGVGGQALEANNVFTGPNKGRIERRIAHKFSRCCWYEEQSQLALNLVKLGIWGI